ncbi:FAD-containing oxidoreductase [Asticcacaulis taihuensis]|uniref:Pyruvate/2-oxoglutarate dehydrogenase complex, dihydrolipoamide dehydrogenase (E3) component n=1 Tax=Asticcacaulis taihuensis TaxID=260084 RepID=A0A1G4R8H1_9CAUL|nr:FAD-containing oxidoreductase [Asticcacaulis taihuensis]SCW52941.1 Pyruvate/2-oxoglutarate dehydrogenase complex, dihydrolipoamide dehydrogenase (E3) component [Asticcacaulis taihuensis]
MKTFDAIIIGAGQAGPSLAERLSQAGQTVCVVERKFFGGTCVNTGCMPTKALVASAYAAHLARRGADFGVVTGDVRIDMKAVAARAHKVTTDARSGVENWLRGMKTVTVMTGHARFQNATTLQIGDELISAPKIFLNVGGRASVPPVPGLTDVPYLTNSSIVTLDRVPEHLVILGGSYIGLEFAQMYRRFGAQVTVVEKGAHLVAREDVDISEAIRRILEDEGISVRTGVDINGVSHGGDGITVRLSGSEVTGSDLLVATGRRPNTDDLGLDQTGVKLDARGYIEVGDDLQTSVPGIWAMGDCNGRGAFTHTAFNDFEIIAANLLDGENRKVSDRILGYALYIDPPLGRVGMGEAEAEKAGHRVLVSTRPMTRVGRAVEKGETKGFMKVVVDADSRKILGAAILGTGGDEAIHGVLDMMNAGVTFDVLQWAVPIHPTVSELWPTVLKGLKPA